MQETVCWSGVTNQRPSSWMTQEDGVITTPFTIEMDLRYRIVKLQNSSPCWTDGTNCSISSGDDILEQWTL
uniref:Uncharacterized protein n=1 Tax=Timema bartmani TaxID=61472 RepID=A0A7R9I265_9NEOP|nr:unnamed protein product [Timema bartmani]